MPYSCPYIPTNTAHHYTTEPNLALNSSIYSHLIDMGFRRAGDRIHKPNCSTCQQCVSLRVPVSTFSASRSQRRIINKNTNLTVSVVKQPTPENYYSLYYKYITNRHPETESMQEVQDTFDNFFFSPWSDTFALEIRLPSKELICVAICDPIPQGWSAVYTFYDTDYANHSLGTFSILNQIKLIKTLGLDYLYLGYWINDCDKMNYKTQFKPCEGFIDEQWMEINYE